MHQSKADSTLRSSRAVPHPSTNRALCRLTSEVGRDPVHSTRYGRQRRSCFASGVQRTAQSQNLNTAIAATWPRYRKKRIVSQQPPKLLLGRGPHKNCKNDLDDQT